MLKHIQYDTQWSTCRFEQDARLFGPAIFEAAKLKVLFLGADKKHPEELPRIYTLTHSDVTSKITLAISREINKAQVRTWTSSFCVPQWHILGFYACSFRTNWYSLIRSSECHGTVSFKRHVRFQTWVNWNDWSEILLMAVDDESAWLRWLSNIVSRVPYLTIIMTVWTVKRMVQQITERWSCSRMEKSPGKDDASRALPHQWWQ